MHYPGSAAVKAISEEGQNMLAEERKKIICEIVDRKRAVRVAELSSRLDITEATIRRDLDELQKEHKLRRTHGGAVALYSAGTVGALSNLVVKNIAEKQKIARKAYEYIFDNDTILFDGSSTILELACVLGSENKKNITVLTNSINIVNILSAKVNRGEIKVLQIGGQVEYSMNFTIGELAVTTIRNLRVDKTFMGVNGIDLEYGYSITNMEEAMVKKEMLHSAKQSFVLADNTKFGKSYLAKLAELDGEIDYLITDSKAEDFDYEKLEETVHIIYADNLQPG